jgi:predicted GNAT family acetyltransferase
MDIRHYYKAADFLAQASKFLAKDEARYGLILGLAKLLVDNPHRYGSESPWFCTAAPEVRAYSASSMRPEINAAAMRTPPNMVLLAHFSGSIDLIAEQLVTATSRKYKAIPGVVGDKDLADAFARRWTKSHNVKILQSQAQRIYKLVNVNDVPKAPGKLRVATEADKELVIKWSHAFYIDIHSGAGGGPETDVVPYLEHGQVFLWEDGKPVAMASKLRPTEKGMTVGGVYTPPESRRKGYATSCVAEVSRNILQSGFQFCTLYTDLANPTSNAIYKKIGYIEVGDSVEHTFEVPA